MKKPIKVLQVAPLGAGGVTSLILSIDEQLDREKVRFDYLTFYDRKEFNEERALKYGGKKYMVPIDHFDNLVVRALFKFFYSIKIIHECDPDIIHVNASTPYDMVVGISAKIAGTKKVVIHSHTSSTKRKSRTQILIMKICRCFLPVLSDCNFACSELAAQYMFPKSIIKKNKYTIIKNGINVSKYIFSSDTREEYRKKMKIENRFVIGHIGRFCNAKNHKKLIEIFEQVYKQCRNSRLLLVGSGELQEEIKQLVEQKKLEDVVIFYGATTKVPELLQAMDCFVLPSLYEGLPLAGIEAQTAGLPVIMSDTITREVKVSDLAHYFPLKSSAEEWAEEILKVKSEQPERRDMSEEIRKAGFDIKEISKLMIQKYISLCENK